MQIRQEILMIGSKEIAKSLCELFWLQRLLTKISIATSFEMNLCCDNKTTIDITYNPIQHDRTKHVEVDQHFIKQNLKGKIIHFPFVKSKRQLIDILTKVVLSNVFHNSLDKLSIRDIYTPT